jgi:hypothetical protein
MAEEASNNLTDISDWPTPSGAIETLDRYFGNEHNSYTSKVALLECLRGGFLIAVAHETSIGTPTSSKAQFQQIDRSVWEKVDTNDPVWKTGILAISIYNRSYQTHVDQRHIRVRFSPKGIAAIEADQKLPPRAAESPTLQISNEPSELVRETLRGAPPKAWWDDFWIAMCGQLWGGFIPERQADLERLMHDWASEHGHNVGETTIKTAARKLFRAWQSWK